jgi:perosamine synthetase
VKRQIARTYCDGLGDVPGITLPPEADWAENVFWLYSVLVDSQTAGVTRDQLMAALKERGVDTRPLFPPIHQQPIYAGDQSLPVAERLSGMGLSLPSAVTLSTRDVERVVEAIGQVIMHSDAQIWRGSR